QRPINLVKSGASGGRALRQVAAHSYALRPLARKYECEFAHLTLNSEENRGSRVEDRGSRHLFDPRSSIFYLLLSSIPIIFYSRSSILDPRSSVLCPLSSILYPLSSILYPLSSILYPLSSILYPRSRR